MTSFRAFLLGLAPAALAPVGLLLSLSPLTGVASLALASSWYVMPGAVGLSLVQLVRVARAAPKALRARLVGSWFGGLCAASALVYLIGVAALFALYADWH